jgi:hypothetical protein
MSFLQDSLLKTFEKATKIRGKSQPQIAVISQSPGRSLSPIVPPSHLTPSLSSSSSSSTETWENFEDTFFSGSTVVNQPCDESLKSRLEALSLCDRVPVNEDILNYWAVKRLSDDDIGFLAEIVLAVPATQVSVERAFSGLHWVLSPQRTKLSDKHLDDILTIKLNNDLIDSLDLENIKEIQNIDDE